MDKISIHALLAESDALGLLGWLRVLISIHALLAESDYLGAWKSYDVCYFYPRSPCGERPYIIRYTVNFHAISIHALLAESDLFEYIQAGTGILFLSTLSLRRATVAPLLATSGLRYFYPRSPCGERPVAKRTTDIRPPFLSTLSLRRATPTQRAE